MRSRSRSLEALLAAAGVADTELELARAKAARDTGVAAQWGQALNAALGTGVKAVGAGISAANEQADRDAASFALEQSSDLGKLKRDAPVTYGPETEEVARSSESRFRRIPDAPRAPPPTTETEPKPRWARALAGDDAASTYGPQTEEEARRATLATLTPEPRYEAAPERPRAGIFDPSEYEASASEEAKRRVAGDERFAPIKTGNVVGDWLAAIPNNFRDRARTQAQSQLARGIQGGRTAADASRIERAYKQADLGLKGAKFDQDASQFATKRTDDMSEAEKKRAFDREENEKKLVAAEKRSKNIAGGLAAGRAPAKALEQSGNITENLLSIDRARKLVVKNRAGIGPILGQVTSKPFFSDVISGISKAMGGKPSTLSETQEVLEGLSLQVQTDKNEGRLTDSDAKALTSLRAGNSRDPDFILDWLDDYEARLRRNAARLKAAYPRAHGINTDLPPPGAIDPDHEDSVIFGE